MFYKPVRKDVWNYKTVLDYTTQPLPDDLIFRGVGDSSYKLIPSAYREEGMAKLEQETMYNLRKRGWEGFQISKDMDVAYCEIMALIWFYDMANRQGLRVPDIPRMCSGLGYFDALDWEDGGSFLDNWSDIAAVAQHYGIPTRMLDWTFDVNVALYFATKGVPDEKDEAEHPEAVSLWILNKSSAYALGSAIKYVVPKYCDNPNIRAQSGLFTLLTGYGPGKDLEKAVRELYEELRLKDPDRAGKLWDPILTKVDIPYYDASWIKANFKKRGISYDSVFPGWSGVVESMEIQSGVRGA